MKHPLLLITLIPLLAACGSNQLAPEADRKIEFIEQTGLPKAESYKRALAHFGKSFVNANSAIQVRDEQGGQIVAQGNVPCNALKPALMTLDFLVKFSLDFQAKDNRVRLAFEDLRMTTTDGQISYVGQIGSKKDLEKVKAECIEEVRSRLLSALKETQATKTAW